MDGCCFSCVCIGTDITNIFAGDIGTGIKSTLREFMDETNLCDAVSMLEERDALNWLERWLPIHIL